MVQEPQFQGKEISLPSDSSHTKGETQALLGVEGWGGEARLAETPQGSSRTPYPREGQG